MIVFIGHNAALSGAPTYLLNFIKWVNKNTEEKPIVILNSSSGPLLQDYKKVCRVIEWNPFGFWQRISERLRFDQSEKRKKRIAEWVKKNSKLIFCNTSVNGDVLRYFKNTELRIISRIPEMGMALNAQRESAKLTLENSNKIIAVSRAVKEDLLGRFNFPEKDVSIFYGTIDSHNNKANKPDGWHRERIGASDNTLIIGGCGSVGWRKGTDLFIEIALRVVNESNREVKFVWLGGAIAEKSMQEAKEKIKKFGLEEVIQMCGEVPNPTDYYQDWDVFLMCSREDPFPLVNLEVGLQGIPVLCFANSGGSPELITEIDQELVIPNFDLDKMAKKVISLGDNVELRKRLGDKTKSVIERDFVPKYSYRKLYQLISA